MDIAQANAAAVDLDAPEMIAYALERAAGRAVVTTNFRPGEAVILHLITQQQPDIPVLWIDHGYNTWPKRIVLLSNSPSSCSSTSIWKCLL